MIYWVLYVATVILCLLIFGIGMYFNVPEIIGDVEYLSILDVLLYLVVSMIPIINACVVGFVMGKICNSRITINPMHIHYDVKQRRLVYLSEDEIRALEYDKTTSV